MCGSPELRGLTQPGDPEGFPVEMFQLRPGMRGWMRDRRDSLLSCGHKRGRGHGERKWRALGSPPSHHLPEAVPVEGDHHHGGLDQVPAGAEGEVPALPGDVQ